MFAKRLLQKVKNSSSSPRHDHQHNPQHGNMKLIDLNPDIALHYGVPSTASVLAFDPIQRLLAIGTLDGRIKVIGGGNIEGLLISPKPMPYKSLEFLHNLGFLVSVSNANDIQVWDLENRCIASSLPWESNITAFSVISNTSFMYVGDEYGLMSVLKYDAEEGKLLQLPYHVPANLVAEADGVSMPCHESIVGVLPQPCTENRVLIAYENGLICLWDVSEARAIAIRGNKNLQLDEGVVDSPSEATDELPDTKQEEKEISSLCWASRSGIIVAVGYVDGDIMLWNLSTPSATNQHGGESSNGVVKLQLSSGKRRIPVIVLHWAADNHSSNDCNGQLFIYGGDEIGSEEVLTVLSLEWTSGVQTVRCVGRVDLTLGGSFADMILIPKAGSVKNDVNSTLFVLTNPGQLNVYSDANLSALASHSESNTSLPAMHFPLVVPTMNPVLTVAKLCLISKDEISSKALSEIPSTTRNGDSPTFTEGSKWPLTGGVPNHLLFAEQKVVEKIYMAGYQDGSVRIWDATYPVLSLVSILQDEVLCAKASKASSPVTALDFCSLNTSLAVGNKSGLVFVYKFFPGAEETSLHFVTETNHEVTTIHQTKGLQCTAIFSVRDSPVQTLQFENFGAKLAVGFESGHVAMIDIGTSSLLFLTDCASSSSSPVISIVVKTFRDIDNLLKNRKHSGSKKIKEPPEGVIFVLTRDSHILVLDSFNGSMAAPRSVHPKRESDAISLYVIEGSSLNSEVSTDKDLEHLSQDTVALEEPVQTVGDGGVESEEAVHHSPKRSGYSGESVSDSLVLLCSKTTLRLYSLKSVLLGSKKSIRKVKLEKPCCWSATFQKEGENSRGLILLYQTGVIQIRSLPELEVVSESSLMSILRWNFKANMNKTMSASDYGLIALVNGSELAFISLFAVENDFRIPDSLPCLHDKVLAAAADAAINFSSNQKKKQVTAPGILNGIIKGFKGKKVGYTADPTEGLFKSDLVSHLDTLFSRVPFTDDQEVELNIDDIIIEEPVEAVSTASHIGESNNRDNKSDRDKLLEDGITDMKPRVRTHEEIIASYRKAGDASAVAAQARDKLLQRQEKLERISRRTEELQDGAQNFASMANELVKVMEARKWYHI